MTRAATIADLPSDIRNQVEQRMAADPEIAAAKSVAAGIVPGSMKKKAAAPTQTDTDIERERKTNEDAFLKIANEKVAEADKETERLRDAYPKERTPKRGALLDEPEETEVKRDATGKFVAAEEEEEPEVAESDSDEDDETPARKGKLTHEKALALLRLDGFKSKALEKLSPEDAIELASHREKVRSGVDKMVSELAELKKAAVPASKESPTASPATGASNFDVKAATKRFRETYGDKEAETVEEPMAILASHIESRIEAEKKAFAPVIPMIGELQRELTRSRLERVSPELADDAVWERVVRKAAKMYPNAVVGSDLVDSLTDATSVVVAKLRAGKVSDAEREERQKGQPHTGSRRAPPVPLSRHDAFGALAEAIEDGNTEEVERIRRSMK